MEDREQLKKNLETYVETVKTFDPDLFLIKVALMETKVNPKYIPFVIRAISLLAYGSAFGKIEIFMQKGEITQIKTEESTLVKETAVLITPLK
jgi:hypothetical protein